MLTAFNPQQSSEDYDSAELGFSLGTATLNSMKKPGLGLKSKSETLALPSSVAWQSFPFHWPASKERNGSIDGYLSNPSL